MFWLESDHLTVFTTSSHLAILTKSIIKFTLIFSKQLWDVWASVYIVFKRILVLNILIETQASRICLARLQGSLQYVCLKYFRALVTAKKLHCYFRSIYKNELKYQRATMGKTHFKGQPRIANSRNVPTINSADYQFWNVLFCLRLILFAFDLTAISCMEVLHRFLVSYWPVTAINNVITPTVEIASHIESHTQCYSIKRKVVKNKKMKISCGSSNQKHSFK